jgi:S1-C subfamily serine protease
MRGLRFHIGRRPSRHGIVGLVVAARESARPEDLRTNPPTVKNIATSGSGEAAGIQAGDTLLELDGKLVATSSSFAHEITTKVKMNPA